MSITAQSLSPSSGDRRRSLGRAGYSGTRLNLASLVGQSVRFRFRVVSDSFVGSLGWAVDNFAMYSCVTPVAPAITLNPSNQTVNAGQTATFSSTASGTPTPTVKWQVSSGGPFADIPGATSTTYSFATASGDNGKSYHAVFTNSAGSATSNAATLTVNSAAQTLTVSKVGTGAGSVASSPAGIACGATCAASFAYGTNVTLAATPAAGSSFAGWSGSGCAGTGSCVVAMTAARSVSAQFTRQMGSLSVTLGGLPAGTSVTLGITGPDGFNTTHAMLTGTGFNLSDVATGTYTVTPPLTTVGSTTYSAPVQSVAVNFGTTGTINVTYSVQAPALPPIPDDFDGNGTSDLAVFRPAGGQWFINGVSSPQFGVTGDIPVSGDYNGNGTADVAAYRPSTGQWLVNGGSPALIQWGRTGDIPVPADYDGDKKTDTAVWRTTAATPVCGC